MNDFERQVSDALRDLFPQRDDTALRVRMKRPRRRSFAIGAAMAVVLAIAATLAWYGTSGDGHPAAAPNSRPSHRPAPSPNLINLTRRAPCPPAKLPTATRAQLRGFAAVAALTCDFATRRYPHSGEWEVVIRKATHTDLGALVAALDRPDEERTTGACSLVLVSAPPLVLVDAIGRLLVPRYPRDGCRQPQSAAIAAVRHHEWQSLSVRQVKQLVTQRELTTHCGDRAKDMLYYEEQGTNLSPGEPVLNRHPDLPLHACIYRRSPAAPEEGTFVRNVRLDLAQSNKLREALSGPGPTGACAPQPRFATVATPTYDKSGDADWIIVELGGCWRVYFDEWPAHDGQWRTLVGTADADAVRELLGLG